MRSPIFVLLLIVNLLACPLRCVSCETGAAIDGNCAATQCLCCASSDGNSASDSLPTSESPEPCGDDCNCQNCICEGALVEGDVELPNATDEVSLWTHWLADGRTDSAVLQIPLTRSHAPAGQFVCGRDVRVAHQSWLI